jgi:hypothetical protein
MVTAIADTEYSNILIFSVTIMGQRVKTFYKALERIWNTKSSIANFIVKRVLDAAYHGLFLITINHEK